MLKRFFRLAAVAVALIGAGQANAGPITVDVFPTVGPDGLTSPSYSTWAGNALGALQSGASSAGTVGTPGYYSQAGSSVLGAVINTSTSTGSGPLTTPFNSWNGTANPSAPFNGEFGNSVWFGVHAKGDGTNQIRFSDLQYNSTSSQAGNVFSGSIGAGAYGTDAVGLSYGADRIKGTADDITYTGAALATNLVDEFSYLGIEQIYFGDTTGFPNTPAGQQAYLDSLRNLLANSSGQVSYSLTDVNGVATGTGGSGFVATPEPATMAMFGLGVAGIVAYRRRKSATV